MKTHQVTAAVGRNSGYLESGCGSAPALDFHIGRELRLVCCSAVLRELFQLYVPARQNFHDARIEALAGFRSDHLDRLLQRKRTPVLPVGGKCVQAVYRRKNPRSNGNLLSYQAVRIAASI